MVVAYDPGKEAGRLFYVILAMSGLALAGYTVRVRGHWARFAAFFFVASAIVPVADWVAHGWFVLYRHRPGIATDPGIDTTIGFVMAEVLFVPSFSIGLKLPWPLPRRWRPPFRCPVILRLANRLVVP
jgi:hypothetical protein